MAVGKILVLVGRLALAGVFLFAAYAKLKPQAAVPWSAGSVRTSLSLFAMQVDSYEMLPGKYVSFVAHTLPPAELALGLWLLSGIALRYSALVTSLLIAGFFSVIVRAYAMGLEINCGCFGPGERLGKMTLVRDGSFLALSLGVTIGAFLLHKRKREPIPADAAIPEPQRSN